LERLPPWCRCRHWPGTWTPRRAISALTRWSGLAVLVSVLLLATVTYVVQPAGLWTTTKATRR